MNTVGHSIVCFQKYYVQIQTDTFNSHRYNNMSITVKITGLWDVTADIMRDMYRGYRGTYIQTVPSW